MPAFANQRTITIKRDTDTAKSNFFKVSKDVMFTVMRSVKPKTFELWCYFASNMDGFNLDISPAEICLKTGISETTYRRSFDELSDLGYIIHIRDNLFVFKEISTKPEEQKKSNKLTDEEIKNALSAKIG